MCTVNCKRPRSGQIHGAFLLTTTRLLYDDAMCHFTYYTRFEF